MTSKVRAEWDRRKSDLNRRKHKIDFGFATRGIYDPLKRTDVEGHEHGEIRWRTICEIEGRIFVISHTIREEGDVEIWRIISARKASPRERRAYEETA
jgi:hypothetical protein